MAKYRLRRKSFGLGNAIGTLAKKTWGTGIGKEGYQKVINSTAEAVKAAGQQGFNKGAQSVGLKQGMMNTWNNAGKMGKAGMVGAGVAGTALLAKGLFGGKKQQQAAN